MLALQTNSSANRQPASQAPWQLSLLWQMQQSFRPERLAWITLINQDWYPLAKTCDYFQLPKAHWLRVKLSTAEQLQELIICGQHQIVVVPSQLLSPWPWSHWQRLALRHRCQILPVLSPAQEELAN